MWLIYSPIIVSLFAVLFVGFVIAQIRKMPAAKDKAADIVKAVQEGAMSYLKRQYKTVSVVAALLFLIILFYMGWKAGIGFLLGAVLSGLSGFVGMLVSTQTNSRVVEAAKKGTGPALDVSFKGGLVTGLLVVSLGLLAVSGYYFLTGDIQSLITLGFGASLISVFARVGGGIYTKAADVGADLVGKVEKNIPEDDPKNPAVIADLVGDNVGDCAGMAADIFETYVLAIVAAMLLGVLLFPKSPEFVLLPLFLGSVSILTSIIASFFVRPGKKQGIMAAIYKGIAAAAVLSAAAFYPLISKTMQNSDIPANSLYFSSLVGLIIAIGMFVIAKYYASKNLGVWSTALPVLLIAAGTVISFWLAGIYGVALAAMAMLSLSGIIVGIDAYSPIADNAGRIAQMSGMPEEARKITDSLGAVGNTTRAAAKGYAIVSAGLAALVLFFAYSQQVIDLSGIKNAAGFMLDDPKVIAGLLMGGLLIHLFVSFLIRAAEKTAGKVVEEAGRQFKQIAGLMEGSAKPDYRKCIDIVTKAAIKEMWLPVLIPALVLILVGFALGPQALGGLLIGSIVTGLLVSISMATSGAAINSLVKGLCVVGLLIVGFLV